MPISYLVYDFLGSPAKKLPSMISCPKHLAACGCSLFKDFRHVLLFFAPLFLYILFQS